MESGAGQQEKEVLTVKQAAELLGVSTQAIYSKYKSKLQSRNGKRVILQSDLQRNAGTPLQSNLQEIHENADKHEENDLAKLAKDLAKSLQEKQEIFAILANMQEQLKEKDRQIAALHEMLRARDEQATALIEISKAAQVLQLTAQQPTAETLREPANSSVSEQEEPQPEQNRGEDIRSKRAAEPARSARSFFEMLKRLKK